MKLETLAALAANQAGWTLALANSGKQIDTASGLLIWLLVAVLTGAATGCLAPTIDGTRWPRKLAGAFLAGVGLLYLGFAITGADPTVNRIMGFGWLAGTIGWLAIPIVQRGGLDKLKAAIKGISHDS